MLARWIHARERFYAHRDDHTRDVRPFEWGAEYVEETAERFGPRAGNRLDPPRLFREHSRGAMRHSAEFYAAPQIKDYRLEEGERLTWTSAVRTPAPENNTVRARFFPAEVRERGQRKDAARKPANSAVLVLPQWNAQPGSHVDLCRLLNRLGVAALRLTLPYHEQRRPPESRRADHLVSPNVGRSIQSMRQAVLDTRAAVTWLKEHAGFERVGILGTSIGSCVSFLAYSHDERIDTGVFNHVSSYVADVVWRGISTRHVRAGFGDHVTLDELREYWLPTSPRPFIPRLLKMKPRPTRFIAARYDLTFPADLSREVIAEARGLGIPLDVAWLPCGHYTSGEKPWVYLNGWKIAAFFRKHLR